MKKHRVLWIIISIYLLIAAAVFAISLILNHGVFIYALDDAYIHMSMANNFVNYGHWATNGMEFASASSSPLWVLIISAIYFVFGVNAAVPFILNVLFQILSIIIVYYILKEYGVSEFLTPFLLAFVFITPLPAVLFGGMEHSAQIFFALLFIFLAVKLITAGEKSLKNLTLLLLITPIFTALRYEDIILAMVICVLLFARRKKFYAVLIFMLSFLPLVIYGIISTSHGWLFVPNTILLKSTPPDLTIVGLVRFCFKAFTNNTEPHIFVLLIMMSFLYILNFKREKNFRDKKQIFLLAVILTTIINMSLIEYHHIGAFYRYEAYLMALGIAAISISVYDFLPDFSSFLKKTGPYSKYAAFILLLVIFSPLVVRAFTIFGIPTAMKEYHDQQYQMAQFINLYAKGMTVGANDVGLVNYYSKSKIVDLWGIANMDVARQKLNRGYTTNTITELTKKENMRLAVIYEHWFDQYGGLPPSWKKLADWTMTEYNFFLGTETVSFYSTNPVDEPYLKEKLQEFSLRLPKSVSYKIY
jgi:hypothetical protein